jgi:hypothetical protein
MLSRWSTGCRSRRSTSVTATAWICGGDLSLPLQRRQPLQPPQLVTPPLLPLQVLVVVNVAADHAGIIFIVASTEAEASAHLLAATEGEASAPRLQPHGTETILPSRGTNTEASVCTLLLQRGIKNVQLLLPRKTEASAHLLLPRVLLPSPIFFVAAVAHASVIAVVVLLLPLLYHSQRGGLRAPVCEAVLHVHLPAVRRYHPRHALQLTLLLREAEKRHRRRRQRHRHRGK